MQQQRDTIIKVLSPCKDYTHRKNSTNRKSHSKYCTMTETNHFILKHLAQCPGGELQGHIIGVAPNHGCSCKRVSESIWMVTHMLRGINSVYVSPDCENRTVVASAVQYNRSSQLNFHRAIVHMLHLSCTHILSLAHYSTGDVLCNRAAVSSMMSHGCKVHHRIWKLPVSSEQMEKPSTR